MNTELQYFESDRYELGRLYFKNLRLEQASSLLREEIQDAKNGLNWDQVAKLTPLLIRILAERLENDEISLMQKDLLSLPKVQWNSGLFYTFGICEAYSGEFKKALSYFDSAHEMADTPHSELLALFGKVTCLFRLDQTQDAQVLFDQLEARLDESPSIDLKISYYCLSVYFHLSQGEEALAWAALSEAEKLCRVEHNLYMMLNALFARVRLYKSTQKFQEALNSLSLLKSLTIREELKQLWKQIKSEEVEILSMLSQPSFSWVEDGGLKLRHPLKGEVPFGRKGLLFNLMNLFLKNKGQTLSKEDIVNALWHEEYSPILHDNKLYVTIKRLRKIIEPNDREPQFLISVNNGYMFLLNSEEKA